MKRIGICALLVLLVLIVSINGSFADTKAPQGRMDEEGMRSGMPMSPPALHAGPGPSNVPPPKMSIWRHLRDLGLDEKQKESIKAIRTKALKEMIRKKADEQLTVIDLKDLLTDDSIDMKAVEAKLRQLESVRTDMRIVMLRCVEDVKAKLTPDQRKKWKKLCETGREMKPPLPTTGEKMRDHGKMDARKMPSMIDQMARGDKRMPPPGGMDDCPYNNGRGF